MKQLFLEIIRFYVRSWKGDCKADKASTANVAGMKFAYDSPPTEIANQREV